MDLQIVSVSVIGENGDINPGDTVTINAYAYNGNSERKFAVLTGTVYKEDGTAVKVLQSTSHWVEVGSQRVFGDSFTMPDYSVYVWLWIYHWDFDAQDWEYDPDDSYGPVSITINGGTPGGGEAEIRNIKVNDFPVGSGPAPMTVGESFRFTFDAKNLQSSGDIRFEASVRIKDPDGLVVYTREHIDPAWPWTGPGEVYEFRFPKTSPTIEKQQFINKAGIWKADIYLYDHGTAELLDKKLNFALVDAEDVPGGLYNAEIVQPFNSQEGIREGNGNWKNPATNPKIAIDSCIQLRFRVLNTGTMPVEVWGYAVITNPNGLETYSPSDQMLGSLQPGSTHQFTFPLDGFCKKGKVGMEGQYDLNYRVEIKGSDGIRREVDSQDYNFTVVGEPGGNGGEYDVRMDSIYVDQTGGLGGERVIPVEGILGKGARVSFWTYNESYLNARIFCAKVWVYGPGGENDLKYYGEDCSDLPILPRGGHKFTFPSAIVPPGGDWFQVDEAGEWTIKVRLEGSGGELFDSYEGVLFSGTQEEPQDAWNLMTDMMPMMMIMMMFGMMMPMVQDMGAGYEE